MLVVVVFVLTNLVSTCFTPGSIHESAIRDGRMTPSHQPSRRGRSGNRRALRPATPLEGR